MENINDQINDQINALEERMYKSELRKSTRKLDLKMLDLKMEDLLEKPNTGLKIKQIKDRCGNFAKPAESFKPAYSFFMKAR